MDLSASSSAARRNALRKLEGRFLDDSFFRSPVDFSTVLVDLLPAQWPPTEQQALHLGHLCSTLIHALYSWEGSTRGDAVIDAGRGLITTAAARRLLAQTTAVADCGDIAVTLIPEGPALESDEGTLFVELRAFADPERSLPGQQRLQRPEMLIGWEYEGKSYDAVLPLMRRGGHWYMLEQLRDDLREGRIAVA